MLDYRIETFLSLCDTKSYTRTAEELHLTQPAVTQHVKALEQYYQCQLFGYKERQVYLTDAGEYLLEKMQKIYRQEMEIQQKILRMGGNNCPLRVGVTPSVLYASVMDKIRSHMYEKEQQKLKLSVDLSQNLMAKLQKGVLDGIVLEGDVYHTQMNVTSLAQEQMIAVALPSLAEKLYGCSWSQLFKYPLVLMAVGCGLRGILQKNLKKWNASIRDFAKVYEADSFPILKEMVQSGMGIGFFLETAVVQEREKHQLERVYMDTGSIFGTYSFAFMQTCMKQELILQLRDQLLTKE